MVEALKSDIEILTQENIFIEQEREKEVAYYKSRFEEKERQEGESKEKLRKEVETIK
jgi:hypothetical protein